MHLPGARYDFGEARRIAGNDGGSASHRFKRRQTEAFVKRRIDKGMRSRIKRGEVGVFNIAGESHRISQLQLLDQFKYFIEQPAATTGEHELWFVLSRPQQL